MVNPIDRAPVTTGADMKLNSPQQPAKTGRAAAQRSESASSEKVAFSTKAQFANDIARAARQSDGVDSERVQAVRAALAQNTGRAAPTEIAKALSQAFA